MADTPVTTLVPPISRRTALAGLSAAAIVAGLPAPAAAGPSALEDYRLHMEALPAANASPVWDDVDRWNDREQEILAQMAATPGGLGDLLAKVIIMADRAEDFGWSLMDVEHDLLASMRDQAERLLVQA